MSNKSPVSEKHFYLLTVYLLLSRSKVKWHLQARKISNAFFKVKHLRDESLIGSQWKTNVFYLKGRNRGRWRWKNPPAKKRTENQDPAVCTNRTAMSLSFWVISENCFAWFMTYTVFNWTMWPYCDTVSHTGSSLKVMCPSSPRISSPKHGFILTLTEHDETAVKHQKLYYITTSKGERKRAVRVTFPADYSK